MVVPGIHASIDRRFLPLFLLHLLLGAAVTASTRGIESMPGKQDVDTYAKQKRWADKKKRRDENLAMRIRQNDIAECTFEPHINPSSRTVKSRLLQGTATAPPVAQEPHGHRQQQANISLTSSITSSASNILPNKEAEAMTTYVARQLEARRRREEISSGATFQTKKSALTAQPFQLSRSNKTTHAMKSGGGVALVSESQISSQKELFDRIDSYESEIALLKIKSAKEQEVLQEELAHRHEEAMRAQADAMRAKHEKEREAWQNERAVLLQLVETFKSELEQRNEAKTKAEGLAEIIATAVSTLDTKVLEIQKHTVEELRLLRQKVLGSGAGTTAGSAVDVDTIKGLFRQSEKTMRKLLLGRELSASTQYEQMTNHFTKAHDDALKKQLAEHAKKHEALERLMKTLQQADAERQGARSEGTAPQEQDAESLKTELSRS